MLQYLQIQSVSKKVIKKKVIKKGNCTLYCSRALNTQHIEIIIPHYYCYCLCAFHIKVYHRYPL